jgi:excisionase family DNA binding protein
VGVGEMGPLSCDELEQFIEPETPGTPENEEMLELARFLARPRRPRSAFLVSTEGARLTLPPRVFDILARVVEEMARGNVVSIVPVHHELTTQEAADLLNVSRPHVVKLLENGEIPFHLVGTHRRVRFYDVMAYREKRTARRRTALRELAEENAKLGL